MEKKEYHGHPRFYELLDEIATLHSNKNRDYTGSRPPLWNFEISGELLSGVYLNTEIPNALKSILNQIFIKIARLSVLYSGKEPPRNESVRDTLIDVAVYCLLAAIEDEEWRRKQ